jgi:hypothetical protein
VFAYRLHDGQYAHTGTFTADETVAAPGLGWASFDVADLIDKD